MGNSTRVTALLDRPMWASIAERRWSLQCCTSCNSFRYPPEPICAECRSFESTWNPVAGGGTILSWVRFHRSYFDDHPAPYVCVAVRLDEGPIVVSNLVGEEPAGEWIGRRVQIEYAERREYLLPVMRLVKEPS